LLLAGSASIIVLWYMSFVNHTYIHYQFMGRIGVLPAAAGFMALGSASQGLLSITGLAAVPIAGLLVLGQRLSLPQIVEVRPEFQIPVDAATCSNDLPLRPDGKPDIVWRVTLRVSSFAITRLLGVSIY